MLSVKVFSFDVDPTLLFSEFLALVTIIGAFWKMYFKIGVLNKEIISNRTANAAANEQIKKDLTVEIARVNKENVDRNTSYEKGLQHITTLVDQHSKSDEQKFSQILTQLSDISSKIAVAVDRVGLIIDGKLGK